MLISIIITHLQSGCVRVIAHFATTAIPFIQFNGTHCVITLKFYYAFNIGIQSTKLFIRNGFVDVSVIFETMRHTHIQEME